MKIKVQFKKEHIKKGKRANSHACPIALALHDTFKERITVESGYCLIGDRNSGNLPVSASRFIDNFDDGLFVKPFSFYTTLHET